MVVIINTSNLTLAVVSEHLLCERVVCERVVFDCVSILTNISRVPEV